MWENRSIKVACSRVRPLVERTTGHTTVFLCFVSGMAMVAEGDKKTIIARVWALYIRSDLCWNTHNPSLVWRLKPLGIHAPFQTKALRKPDNGRCANNVEFFFCVRDAHLNRLLKTVSLNPIRRGRRLVGDKTGAVTLD